MRQYQPYIQQLDSLTFTIGTAATKQEIDLRKLEKKIFKEGEISNLLAFVFECDLDPTFTAHPTVIGLNNSISKLVFTDGADTLFDGSFNDLRLFETLENGWSPQGEAVQQNSTDNRYFTRVLHMGPPRMAGSPSDYSVACAELAQGGKLEFTTGVLTDISADTTAAVLVVNVFAVLAPVGNELRFGPKLQRVVKPIAGAETNIADEALYSHIGAIEASHGAFSAADFSKITVSNTKMGRFVDNVDAEGLTRVFNMQHTPGMVGQVMGEPRSSTDLGPRIVNIASATALAAQAAALQPIVWSPPGTRLSKLRVRNDSDDTLTVKFSGAQGAAGNYLLSRFLPHSADSVKKRAEKAAKILGMSQADPQIKTLDKRTPKLGKQVTKYGVYYSKAA